MKIHYSLKNLLAVVLFLTASTATATPGTHPGNGAENVEARIKFLTERLDEIKTLDKSQLSRIERKNLRKEVREIKKELAVASGGVYLSVGALVLIGLLLILLL